MIRRYVTFAATALCLVMSLGLAACNQRKTAQTGPTGGYPPAPISILIAKAHDEPLNLRFPGRITGLREVDVRAQVGGILLHRSYDEGSTVKAGDVLYQIDPQPYEADLARAKAQLEQAHSTLVQTQNNLQRTSALFGSHNASAKARDDARSAHDRAKAAVAAAIAAVHTAQINLDYTTVRAPISGVTSISSQSEGSLIGTSPGQSLLTKITQLDPVYVNFFISGDRMARLRTQIDLGHLIAPKDNKFKVEVHFSDDTTYDQTGVLDFTAHTIDPATGTIRLRATIPNNRQILVPGQFVRVVMKGLIIPHAIVIPPKAVMQSPQGTFVYVVNADSKASVKPIKLGDQIKAGWVVTKGLAPGDKVITDGVVKIRPGAPVRVTPDAPPPGAATKTKAKNGKSAP